MLNLLNDNQFVTLCEVIFNTPKYENEFVFNVKLIRRKPFKELIRVFFQIPNDQNEVFIQKPHVQEEKAYYMFSYVCAGWDPIKVQQIKKFKIAVGPGNNSVIVVKETELVNNYIALHEIIEFVDNLTLEYINLHEQNLY